MMMMMMLKKRSSNQHFFNRTAVTLSLLLLLAMMSLPPTESLSIVPTPYSLSSLTRRRHTQLHAIEKKNDNGLVPPYGGLYSNVFDTTDDSRFSLNKDVDQATLFDESLKYFPMLLPFLAYLAYDPTAQLFAAGLDALMAQNNNWVVVDGGAYQAKIIAPAINGVVVPAISILFANLIGTTIQTLRQRQLDIRTCLNMEAGQLRILQSLLDVFPRASTTTATTASNTKDNNNNNNSALICRRYLTQYTTRLIAESQPTLSVESLDYSLDTELNGVLAELNRLSATAAIASTTTTTTTTTSATTTSTTISPILLGNAYTACSKLYEERAKRITALRSLFPPLHFIIVSALAVSICIAFLLESKQDILVFLNAIQLRILWTMLVGTFTALAIVCYDLGNPFRGSYQISKSVQQLYTIRMTLRASLKQQKEEEEDKNAIFDGNDERRTVSSATAAANSGRSSSDAAALPPPFQAPNGRGD
jgi:hypothetical protein